MSQVVVVAGASAGVGRAVVREFARRGAALGLVARGAAGLEAARADAERLGAADVVAVQADVADAGQVAEAARRFETEFGPYDVWVNNAMVSVFANSWDVRPDEFRRVMEVNFLGYVHGTQEALARMRPRGSGTMVQMPALNTPQFSWVRTRLSRHPQPVPPTTSRRSPRGRSSGRPSTVRAS